MHSLAFAAFEKANKDANPLAVRAIFDTFNTSTDIVAPDQAQALIDEYKANPSALAGKLLKAKLIGFSSIFTLLFLLGLADVVAFGHAKGNVNGWIHTCFFCLFYFCGTLLFLTHRSFISLFCTDGWFPNWPGLEDLPWSLFDSEKGLTKIPSYWLGDDY
jgi:hypothetical protein